MLWLAAGLVLAGVILAFALPEHTFQWGTLSEVRIEGEPTGEVVCSASDLGYRPRSWLPTKIAIASAGLVAASVVVLAVWRR